MNVSFGSKDSDRNALITATLGSRALAISVDSSALVVKDGTLTVALQGELYYRVGADGKSERIPAAGREAAVRAVLQAHGPEGLPAHLEGSYVGAWYDEAGETAGLFADTLNRHALYVVEQQGRMLATTELEAAVDAAGARGKYNQQALYSYFVLGYPGARETFYAGVTRLAPDELVRFGASGAERTTQRVVRRIEDFGREMFDEYDRRISTAVSARASEGENVVMNSGGWDSTALISLLTREHDAKAIHSVVFDVVLPDGQSFNVYEVDKAKRIAEFFGTGVDRAVIDYGDKSLVDYWEAALPTLRSKHVYFWLHHLKIADTIADTAGAGAGVFNGEASDSIHNFGYSQFVSVNYDNMYLREYADKAKSYLYGPTFFQRVDDGSFGQDRVLGFFQSYYGKDRFESPASTPADRRAQYFEAFMLSYPRVPFARWQSTAIGREPLRTAFDGSLRAGAMRGAIEESTAETLYYWLLQLYREFHFQSYQIAINHVAMGRHGMRCHMPFLDAQMVDYMYRMPESWGRGLELRTTKYPLRYLATERWRMPIHILEEAGPHSYIAENDKRWTYAGGSWSIYCEIMFCSVFADYFKQLLSTTALESVLDPELFDVAGMKAVVQDYVNGKENPADVGLLFKLGMLFSIGLYA